MKFLSGLFFILFIIKYYPHFYNEYLEVQTFFRTINLKKYTIGDDDPHITAILQWNMNIAATFHL